MTAPQLGLHRRARRGGSVLVAVAALLSLVGCAGGEQPTPPPVAPPAGSSSAAAPSASAQNTSDEQLAKLEEKFDARLGVYAVATDTGASITHRADERFAFCSTFKGLATAAVLARNPLSHLDKVVTYSNSDLVKHAPVTKQHVTTGMTIRQLSEAAIRYSDGTAGNLLVRDLGGPTQLTEYARGLGDTVTRMDRTEPALTEATPGDPRDTTSPKAIGTDYQRIILGDALTADKRTFLRDLLERNTTGDQRIRAGVPHGWTVADKTGSCEYGGMNDIGVVWPPNSAPIVISIMSSKDTKDATYNEALIAEATKYITETLT